MYGIDYGTTNSSICYYDIDKKQIVPIIVFDNSYFLPSVISIKDEQILTGILLRDAEVIRSPKRNLDIENEASIISSYHLLKHLRSATGHEQISAVVTIPVNYNHSQREAMKTACEMAGIDVVQFLNEPTAIALGYNVKYDSVLILDIGGGTVDISLLEYDEENTFYHVQETQGDSNLGGEDINLMIMDKLGLPNSQYVMVENAKKSCL